MPVSTDVVWIKCKPGTDPKARDGVHSQVVISDEEEYSASNAPDNCGDLGKHHMSNTLPISFCFRTDNSLESWRDPDGKFLHIENKSMYKLNPNLRVLDVDGSLIHPKDYEKKLPEGTVVVVRVTLKSYVKFNTLRLCSF